MRDDGTWPRRRRRGASHSSEGAPTIRLADKGALPTIRLATILGMLATAVLLGVVSATAGLGVAGWIAGLATGSAAAALLVTARMRSDQPAILPADWVTLTRTVLIAGVAGLVADSFGRSVSITALVTLSTVALALDAVDGQVARGPAPPPRWAPASTARSTPSSSCCSASPCPRITAAGCWPSAPPATRCCWRAG